MPQKSVVLCCCSCRIYQAVLVNSKRWKCKDCNNTQSIGIVYYYGTLSKCREEAEELNDEMIKKREEESSGECPIGSIEAWGLDCEGDADDDLIELCQCSKHPKLIDGESSKYHLGNSADDEPTENKENISTDNSLKRKRSSGKRKKTTRSLPSARNFMSRHEEPRSRTFPRMNDKLDTFHKWENFSEDKEDEDIAGDELKEKRDEATKKNVLSISGTSLHSSSVIKWDTILDRQENGEDSDNKREVRSSDSWTEEDFLNDKETESDNESEDDDMADSDAMKSSQVDTSSENSSPNCHEIELNSSDY